MGSDAIRVTDQIADISGLTSALSAKQATSEKNQANGYLGLDSAGDAVGTFIPRIGTAAALASIVPQSGEIVYETDTTAIKVGDGATACSSLAPRLPRTPADTTNAYVRHLLYQFSESTGDPGATADLDVLLTPYGKPSGRQFAIVSIDALVIAIDTGQNIARYRRRCEFMDTGTSPSVFWQEMHNSALVPTDDSTTGTVTFSLINPTTTPAFRVHVVGPGSGEGSKWAAYLVLTHLDI
jgi:hypothetical protein